MEIAPLLLLLYAGVCGGQEFISHLRKPHKTSLPKNWCDARNYCQTTFTDLLAVYRSDEATLLSNTISFSTPIWTGFYHRGANLTWPNGDPVDYRPWKNFPETTNTSCATVTANKRIEWTNCTVQQHFMCYQKENNGSSLRYTLITQKMTWCGAQSYCRQKHTDLAVVRDQSQYDEVIGTVSTSAIWIELQGGKWEWCNGEIVNNTDESLSCEYVIYLDNKFRFESTSCKKLNFAICYKDVTLEIVYDEMNWEDARKYCFDNHDAMLTIYNQSDQRVVEQKLECAGFNGHMWVGLKQSRILGLWLWTSDVPVQWSNWKGGRIPEMPLSNNCGAIGMEDGFKWSDQNCFVKRPFICEGEKKKPTSQT